MNFWTYQDFEIADVRCQYTHMCCTICTSFMVEPMVAPCGHSFCKECVPRLQKCGTCRADMPPTLPPNVGLLHVIARIPARCTLCDWEGHVEEILSHRSTCPNIPIECTNAGCGLSTMRKDMLQHQSVCTFRMVTCEQCQESVPFLDKRSHQQLECEEISISCPYANYTEAHTVLRKDFTSHIHMCRIKQCTVPGCHFFGSTREMAEHNPPSHNFLRNYQFQMLAQLTFKHQTTSQVQKRLKEVIDGEFHVSWAFSDIESEISRSNSTGTPITSPNFRDGLLKWRCLIWPKSNTFSVQLRASLDSIRGSLSLSYQGSTAKTKVFHLTENQMVTFNNVRSLPTMKFNLVITRKSFVLK